MGEVVHLPREATLLTPRARRAIASGLEGLGLVGPELERARPWIECFRSGDWSRVMWLSVKDTALIHRGIEAALSARLADGELLSLLGAFSPYRFVVRCPACGITAPPAPQHPDDLAPGLPFDCPPFCSEGCKDYRATT